MTTNKNKTVLKPITFKALKVLFKAAGVNSVRFFLNGILVDHENGNLVATNGHILAVISGCVVKTGNKSDNRWMSHDVLKTLTNCLTSSTRIAFDAPGHIKYTKKGNFGKGLETSDLRYDTYKNQNGFDCVNPQTVDYANAFPKYHRVMHVDAPRDEFSWLNPVYLYAWYEIAEALGWERPIPEVTPGGRNVEDHFGEATRLYMEGYEDRPDFDFYIMPTNNEPSMIPVENGKTIEQEGK